MKTPDEFIVYDSETTGLLHEGGKLVELGAVRYWLKDGEIKELARFQCYINEPGRRVHGHAFKVNGITAEVLESEGISEAEAVTALWEFGEGCVLWVSYNGLAFDNKLINPALSRVGLGPIKAADCFDVMKQYLAKAQKLRKPRFASYGMFHGIVPRKRIKCSLSHVAALHGVKVPEGGREHSALTDALVTAGVFAKISPFF